MLAVITSIDSGSSNGDHTTGRCRLDATNVYNALLHKCGCPAGNLRLLSGNRNEHGELRTALEWLADSAADGETIMFYYSGPGISAGGKNYLLTGNGPATAGSPEQAGMALDEIITILSRTKARQAVVLIDPCYPIASCAAVKSGSGFNPTFLPGLPAGAPIRLLAGKGHSHAVKATPGVRRGIFTQWLVEGLSGSLIWAGGDIDFQALQRYVVGRTTEESIRRFFKHFHPVACASRDGYLVNITTARPTAELEDHALAARLMGLDCCLSRDWAGAVSWLQQAVDAVPQDTTAHVLLAYAQISDRQYGETMNGAKSGHSWQRDQYSLVAHGVALKYLKRLPEAVSAFQAAGKLDPNYGYPHFGMGNILLRQGCNVEAREAYRRAIELEPDFADSYYGLGTALVYDQFYDEARVQYQLAMQLDPTFALPHCGLGFIHHSNGRIDAAVEEYRTAIMIDPNEFYSFYGMGRALKELERIDLAEANLRECVRLEPHMAGAYFELGTVLACQQRYDEAIPSFQQVIELRPDHLAAVVGLATSYRATGNDEQALAELLSALEADPTYAPVHTTLAELYLNNGDYRAAWKHAHQAMTCSSPGQVDFDSGRSCVESITRLKPELASLLAGQQ